MSDANSDLELTLSPPSSERTCLTLALLMSQNGESNSSLIHVDLRILQEKLQTIHDSIEHFRPAATQLPILDSSLELSLDNNKDDPWTHQDHVSGLKKLKDTIKIDLDVLDKVWAWHAIQ